MLITMFFQEVYLPHVERNLKRSTAEGYKKTWNAYLKGELTSKQLSKYRTSDVTNLLTRLVERGLGARTVAHVRSLLGGLFGHAVAIGVLETNPVHDAKVLVKATKPKETTAYTLLEINQIITALSENRLAQIAVALAAYAGLRPSEIAGLRWEDVKDDQIVLRRSVVCGIVNDSLKTEGSAATVPLLSTVRDSLASASFSDGWIFCQRSGLPVNMDEFCRKHIAIPLRAQGIRWSGLYGCRRSCATILTQLTGSPWAAQAVLRHSSASTTLKFYVRMNQNDVAQMGVTALEAAVQTKALAASNTEVI